MRIIIRKATAADLDAIAAVESMCFPRAEAATKDEFQDRLNHYADHFLLLFEDGILVSMINGMVSDQKDLSDRMYDHAEMHQTSGSWQMIFGVDTLPAYRRRGYAGILIRTMIHDARSQGRKGLVLTYLKEKIHYYERFGFVNEGVSSSVHGGAEWYQMRLTF